MRTHAAKRAFISLLAVAAATSALSGCAFVARSGQPGTGLVANGNTTLGPNLSADGRYVVFGSAATNLVPGDTNGVADTFLRDRNTGVTERVSVSSTEVEGNGAIDREAAVSDNGDVVAFVSLATNLDPDCNSTYAQVYVRTRSTGTTECVSVGTTGVAGTAGSDAPQLSGNGRLVAFASDATNLVAGDTNFAQDVFVRDLLTNTTERVNLKRDGTQSAGDAFWPAISADGRYVGYRTGAGDLDPACPAGALQIILTDRKTDTNECVSVSSSGQAGNGYSDAPSVSADGRYVAFYSVAVNLDPACAPPPTPGPHEQSYVRDRETDTTTCESIAADGSPADTTALFPRLSGDGRTMSFLSTATNLDSACSRAAVGPPEMFVRDLDTGVNTCVSVDEAGRARGSLNDGSLSADGHYVAFLAIDALVATDTNGIADFYVHDNVDDLSSVVSNASVEPDADVTAPELSDDGRYLAFSSAASNLVPGDVTGHRDIFRRDLLTGDVIRLSVSTLFGIDFAGNATSRNPSITGDGRAVAFVSDATNLVGNDTNAMADVFVREPGARSITRVSVGAAGVQANGASGEPAISADGRYVAFESTATNLDPNCTGAMNSVYVRDRTAGTTTCVAPLLGGFRDQVAASGPTISADGRSVAMRSLAGGDLPCGSTGWIFVWDRVTTLADCVARGTAPDIAASGQLVAFTSNDATLDPPCTNGLDHVFVGDPTANTNTCVSVTHTGAVGNGASGVPSITADGRYVAFRTSATNLVYLDSDTNGQDDVVVHDRTLNWTTPASRDAYFAGGSGASDAPAISTDGALVAFQSAANDIVDGDTLGHTDVFVRAARAIHVDPQVRVLRPGASVAFTLRGLGFRPDTLLSSGAGITLSNISYVGPDQIRVTATAAADAALGPRDINVANAGPAWGPTMITFDQCACLTVM